MQSDQQREQTTPDQVTVSPGGSGQSIEAARFVPSKAGADGLKIHPWQVLLGTGILFAVFIVWFLFTSKSVQIRMHPPAEQVQISGGLSFELGGVYLLRQGGYRIEAETPLHEPFQQDFTVSDERNQIVEFNFTPLPGLLSLMLQPEDAKVTINGVEYPPTEVYELPSGKHELLVTHPRYLPLTSSIEIQGRQVEQNLSITLDPNWANVNVSSTPTGAAISVDDKETGLMTPAVIEALAGEREISIRLQGYKIHREQILAQAGQSVTLAPAKLVQADAQLHVTSSPAGAGVTVNGRFMGQTPMHMDLISGQAHRIQVIYKGYATYTRTRTLKRGAIAELHADLVLQKGTVTVRSEPAGARLHIDGRTMGSANQTLDLPIRPHELSISLDGYAGYTQNITPKVGLIQEIKVRLLSLEEARLRALKPNILTNAGQNLKLFKPFGFTMGASRREPGRRANETLREVVMRRLFYLSTHEVTNAQFRRFASGHDSGEFEEVSLNEDDMPVSSVSWHDAAAYCNWLSKAENLPLFYQIEFGKVVGVRRNATGYRLPMEAEWAWAARTMSEPAGQAPGPGSQLRFPWGANLPPPDRHGNYADRAASALVGRTIFGYNDNHTAAAPVGTFKPNHRGLYDLGGNVAEWMHDFYEIPGKETVHDPTGPASGEYHVMRGSSWMHGTITELRHSFRDYGIQGRQDVGFRIARYAE